MKYVYITLFSLAAITSGTMTGMGVVSAYELFFPKYKYSEVTRPDKFPQALYKETFITQTYPEALKARERGTTLKVSEMLAMAAIRSSFGHSPDNSRDAITSILWDEGPSEFEKELIRIMNLTQYDTL